MEKLFSLLFATLLTTTVWAQSPNKMTYEAIICDANNNLVTGNAIAMQLSILQGSTDGTAIYIETQTPTTNANGLVRIDVGGGNVIAGNYSNIDWSDGPYFLKTETDLDGTTGGISYNNTIISQLLSSPNALRVAKDVPASGNRNNSRYIGEEYGGGVIFHLWKDSLGVEHGLVVALTDQSTSYVWCNVSANFTSTLAQSSWDGLSNSNAIVGHAKIKNSAAKLCLDLVSGGQSDWYLPGIQELNMLWNNYYTVGRSLSQITGATQLSNAFYWSSSELSSMSAWCYYFAGGCATIQLDKSLLRYVRAVRAF